MSIENKTSAENQISAEKTHAENKIATEKKNPAENIITAGKTITAEKKIHLEKKIHSEKIALEKTVALESPASEAAITFAALGLDSAVLKAIEESGYTVPTPIQAQAIPEAMLGHDLMASAQTGTGKTAAFMLPALHRIAQPATVRSKGPRVLVLTPTRELAQQVSDAAAKYGKHMRLKVVSILGGMPYPLQNKLLSSPVDILVATPGRLIDHIERGRIDFSRLEMLVLDEADRMLDMGFVDDVERIANATPATRQTLLFSATL